MEPCDYQLLLTRRTYADARYDSHVLFLVLPALYLSGFFFGVREIVRSPRTTAMKGLPVLGLIGLLLFVPLISLAILLAIPAALIIRGAHPSQRIDHYEISSNPP
jgi:hypothetical protein